jgi:hypothetical protein
MNKKFLIIFFFFLLICYKFSFSEYCPVIPINPAIDDYFYRMSTKYSISLPQAFFSQPMTVCDVFLFLDKIDSLEKLGIISKKEAYDSKILRKRLAKETGFFSFSDKNNKSAFNLRCNFLDTNSAKFGNKNGVYIRGILSPYLNAYFENFSFGSQVEVWTDYRSDTIYHQSTYQPYDGLPYNLYGRADSSKIRASDLLRGSIVYNKENVRLEAGIEKFKTGPAIISPLTFSGNAPPQTYIKGSISFGIIDYIQSFGLLKSDKDKPKYFYMHKIFVPLFNSKLIAEINEVVINGSTTNEPITDSTSANALRRQYYGKTRDWEIAYMIPFIPYAFTEHYLGDLDNKTLSFDLTAFMPKNFRWYFEFFLDDYTAPWSLFSNDWGNKWAFDIGGQYFGKILSSDFSITAEYCRVEPWVYTHFFGGSHRYDSFNKCLGAPLGPNSDILFIGIQNKISNKNILGISFTNIRYNHSQRGGNITDVFQDSIDVPIKHFLDKNGLTTDTKLGFLWQYNPFGIFKINLKYDYYFSGRSEIQLYGGLYF